MKKKVKVFLISIFLIIVGVVTINILDSKKEYLVKKTELKYTLPITYVIADKNTAPENISTSDLHKKYPDSYIMPVISYEFVEKDKNGNYTAKINNVNKNLIDSLTNYGFALNDNEGNVIDDVKYDRKTKTITIPAYYYEKEPKKSPIRMEILSLMTLEELKNVKTDVTVNKVFDYDKTSIATALDIETNISIGKYKELKNLKKENIDVYLNDGTIKLKNDDLSFDSTSGVITIPKNVLSIKNIEVDIKDTIVDKISGLVKTAQAVGPTFPSASYYINIVKPEKLPTVGSTASAPNQIAFYFPSNLSNGICQSFPGEGENCNYAIDKFKRRWPRASEVYYGTPKGNDAVGWDYYKDEPLYFPYVVDIAGTWTFSDGSNITFPYQEAIGEDGAQDNGLWVKLYCIAEEFKAGLNQNKGGGMPIEMRILDVDPNSNSIIASIETEERILTQFGGAVYKFQWIENNKGKIAVQKKLKDGKDVVDANKDNKFSINLYEGEDCSGKPVQTVTTDNHGQAVFAGDDNAGLELGTYSFDETLTDEQKFYWEPSVVDSSKRNPYCKNVTIDATDDLVEDETGSYRVESTSYTNIKKKYCANVKKVDAENNNCTLNGITFALKNSTKNKIGEATTGANGVATFKDLDYGSYYYSETSIDKTLSSSSCGGSYHYYNDDPGDKSLSLTPMKDYDEKTGKYTTCDAKTTENIRDDHKVYYCMKVKKVDKVTGEPLAGAKFKIEGTNIEKTTGADGIATFMLGSITNTNYNVIETQAPEGYELPSNATMQVVATAMRKNTTLNQSTIESNCNANVTDSVTYKDTKLLINWYKVTEDSSTKAREAEFKISTGNKYIKVKNAKVQIKDDKGITKNCYVYNGIVNSEDDASILSSDENGEVCVSTLPKGKYIVKEITPVKYHTFGLKNAINLESKTTFTSMKNDNKFINYPTYFEFTKEVAETELQNGKYDNIVTEELKKIEFNILNSKGEVLKFIERTINGNKIYSYALNDIDKIDGVEVSSLYLDDLRKIRIDHLPWGKYSIKEKNTNICDTNSDSANCIGYYYPNYEQDSAHQFTIEKCSSEFAISCSSNNIETQKLTNEPTEIEFTKKDFYNYEDAADIVDFENDKERNDFDRIAFKIKDENGNYLTLDEVGTKGTCQTDDSYREYRYVSSKEWVEGGTTLHTCGGHIKITNLCRGKTYIVEEVSVPEDSVFVKETVQGKNPEVSYKIPCTKGEIIQESNTKIINDKGTRVRFEKRDSKYNYLIPDETTTFKVYRCPKIDGVYTTCNPSNYKDDTEREKAGMKLIKFQERGVIKGDEEDPKDAEELQGVEVYNSISDSDLNSGKKYITELHPYHGILVLRYLQSGYNYVLLETKAPLNYVLSVGKNAETPFTVKNDTVSVKEVDLPNKPTSLVIKKYSTDGKLLRGAQFKVYEGTTCDPNLNAMNQPKKALQLKTIRDGLYEARPPYDDNEYTVVQTCSDKNGTCNKISIDIPTTDSENTMDEDGKIIELQEGEALVQYLEYGHCYIIEEIKAPEGYSLPKNKEDRFTMVTIKEDEKYAVDTGKALINKPTSFTFYKFDEFNKLLDGAEFKLQKLDNDKEYQDVTVRQIEEKGMLFYKVDDTVDNKTIITKNGSATIYFLTPGQYRVLEIKAAPGKELSKNPNIATFFVDEATNVYGNSIIVNKATAEKKEILNDSSAEFIIGIQTGQTVIKYGIIIAVLVVVITGLMVLRKKTE